MCRKADLAFATSGGKTCAFFSTSSTLFTGPGPRLGSFGSSVTSVVTWGTPARRPRSSKRSCRLRSRPTDPSLGCSFETGAPPPPGRIGGSQAARSASPSRRSSHTRRGPTLRSLRLSRAASRSSRGSLRWRPVSSVSCMPSCAMFICWVCMTVASWRGEATLPSAPGLLFVFCRHTACSTRTPSTSGAPGSLAKSSFS
ncbi:hypothetical protein VPH35_047538 [Triticum aestivum]